MFQIYLRRLDILLVRERGERREEREERMEEEWEGLLTGSVLYIRQLAYIKFRSAWNSLLLEYSPRFSFFVITLRSIGFLMTL